MLLISVSDVVVNQVLSVLTRVDMSSILITAIQQSIRVRFVKLGLSFCLFCGFQVERQKHVGAASLRSLVYRTYASS